MFETEDEIIESINTIKLDMPIIIATACGNPVIHYGLKIIGTREINYKNASDYKNKISLTTGNYDKNQWILILL